MRTDSEIKSKILELLALQGTRREEQLGLLDRLDPAALGACLIEHHSTRGMVEALYWALGYDFKDIYANFADPSISQNRPDERPSATES